MYLLFGAQHTWESRKKNPRNKTIIYSKFSLSKIICNLMENNSWWGSICINNIPFSLGDIISEFETLDLVTPNQLLKGQSNNGGSA